MTVYRFSVISALCICQLLLFSSARGQEIQCELEIVSPEVQLSNKEALFNTLKRQIENFVNGTVWTGDKFRQEERIRMSMVLQVSNVVNQTDFEASLQLVSSRPVYNSGYTTTMMRIKDDDVDFQFLEYEPLQYVEGSYTSNLSAVLAFYVYMALAIDYDSFGKNAGTPYYSKAMEIANLAQSGGRAGWAISDKGNDNRYWLVNQYLNNRFQSLRTAIYLYHRKGMDLFTTDMDKGRQNVLEAIKLLKKVYNNSPNSYAIQVFLESKRLEIINIFQNATSSQKKELVDVMEVIDIAKASTYRSKLLN